MALFDLDRLLSILNQSGIQNTNNPLYQVIAQLLKAVRAFQDTILTTTGGTSGDVTALKGRTYWTQLDESSVLPASRMVVAGTGISLDYSVANQVTVSTSGSPLGEGYWAPLTDGDLDETDLIFADGECVMVFVPTP